MNLLTNLWAGLIEQGLTEDPEALIPVPEVLDIIQRNIVLIGNTNNLVSETRREVALDAAIHSSLKKYAKGDLAVICSERNLRTSWLRRSKQTVPYQRL